MKKLFTIFGTLLFFTLILSSCGSSQIDKDAKKLAELQCEARKAIAKVTLDAASSGNLSANAITEEGLKWAEKEKPILQEIEAKYTSDSDKKKFAEALEKALQDCK